LAKRHKIYLSKATPRTWMIAEGRWKPQTRKLSVAHQWRPRRLGYGSPVAFTQLNLAFVFAANKEIPIRYRGGKKTQKARAVLQQLTAMARTRTVSAFTRLHTWDSATVPGPWTSAGCRFPAV
jgi:hypothetical protein